MTSSGDRLVIEYQGKDLFLTADPVNAQQCENLLQGVTEETAVIGLARLIRKKTAGGTRLRSVYRFDPYPDPTLRRAFDLDDYDYQNVHHNTNCIGWRNAKNPDGFVAPRGVIPGEQGQFVSDTTEIWPMAIPFEFVELATRLKTDPVTILKSFIADACQLHSTPELPRADGFSSHGSDAERRARDYLRAAFKLKKDFF